MLRAYGDGRMFGEPYGEGPVRVVWLHGWARRSQDFTDSAQIVARAGHASVAIDLPGFGVSPEPDVVGGARHYAELLLPTIRGLGSDPIVMVGHSFGGRVAAANATATRPPKECPTITTGSEPRPRLVGSSSSA